MLHPYIRITFNLCMLSFDCFSISFFKTISRKSPCCTENNKSTYVRDLLLVATIVLKCPKHMYSLRFKLETRSDYFVVQLTNF